MLPDSLPQRPRLIPESTTSLYFALSPRTCSTIWSAPEYRLFPRTNGMMQKEQRLWQPPWVFQFGAGAVAAGIENGRGENIPRFHNVADYDLAVIVDLARDDFSDLRLVRV